METAQTLWRERHNKCPSAACSLREIADRAMARLDEIGRDQAATTSSCRRYDDPRYAMLVKNRTDL
jgi:hypothetical protein